MRVAFRDNRPEHPEDNVDAAGIEMYAHGHETKTKDRSMGMLPQMIMAALLLMLLDAVGARAVADEDAHMLKMLMKTTAVLRQKASTNGTSIDNTVTIMMQMTAMMLKMSRNPSSHHRHR